MWTVGRSRVKTLDFQEAKRNQQQEILKQQGKLKLQFRRINLAHIYRMDWSGEVIGQIP